MLPSQKRKNKPCLSKHVAAFFLGVLTFIASPLSHSAVILQYHHVSDDTPRITSISPALFREHLEYLNENDFKVWPLPRLIEQLESGADIPDKVVAITFDDAYQSIYSKAMPALQKYQWPFTVFVATGPVDSRVKGFMSWEDLKTMTRHGGTIANHTTTHTHLVRRQSGESRSQWLERVRGEIETAQKRIVAKTGQDHKLLAYPYGEYTDDIQVMLSEMGYKAFGQQSGAAGKNHDFTALPRFPMNNDFGRMEQFKTKVSSLPFPAKEISPDQRVLENATALEDGLSIRFFPVEGNEQQLNCYPSFHGKIPLKSSRKDSGINVIIPEMPKAPVGRSRINCTMPSLEYPGRFRWFSVYWMLKKANGEWYEEP